MTSSGPWRPARCLGESAGVDGAVVHVVGGLVDVGSLSPEELAEFEAGIAEADRGDMIPVDAFFQHLRRHG